MVWVRGKGAACRNVTAASRLRRFLRPDQQGQENRIRIWRLRDRESTLG
ncbi:hypothetical protein chiPu_0027063, partial [Chiloscyllium punctatum]|nr:hypothetical protein [Chiloscyllium punctatum]